MFKKIKEFLDTLLSMLEQLQINQKGMVEAIERLYEKQEDHKLSLDRLTSNVHFDTAC